MKRIISIYVAFVIILFAPLLANAESKKAFDPKVDKGAMRAAKSNLSSMISKLIEGDLEAVAKKAEKMKQKSLIKKELVLQENDQEQSAKFIAINAEYEKAVDDLIQSAQEKDEIKVFQQHTAITQSCMKCHMSFAQHRFPKFQED